MKPPALTQAQFDLIDQANFDQLCEWYNELYRAAKANTEMNRLFQYLNQKMADKANEESEKNMAKFKEGVDNARI